MPKGLGFSPHPPLPPPPPLRRRHHHHHHHHRHLSFTLPHSLLPLFNLIFIYLHSHPLFSLPVFPPPSSHFFVCIYLFIYFLLLHQGRPVKNTQRRHVVMNYYSVMRTGGGGLQQELQHANGSTERRAASDNFNYIQTRLKRTACVSSFSPSADILEASRAALLSFCPAESANYLFQDAHSESPLCFYKWGPERERESESAL